MIGCEKVGSDGLASKTDFGKQAAEGVAVNPQQFGGDALMATSLIQRVQKVLPLPMLQGYGIRDALLHGLPSSSVRKQR